MEGESEGKASGQPQGLSRPARVSAYRPRGSSPRAGTPRPRAPSSFPPSSSHSSLSASGTPGALPAGPLPRLPEESSSRASLPGEGSSSSPVSALDARQESGHAAGTSSAAASRDALGLMEPPPGQSLVPAPVSGHSPGTPSVPGFIRQIQASPRFLEAMFNRFEHHSGHSSNSNSNSRRNPSQDSLSPSAQPAWQWNQPLASTAAITAALQLRIQTLLRMLPPGHGQDADSLDADSAHSSSARGREGSPRWTAALGSLLTSPPSHRIAATHRTNTAIESRPTNSKTSIQSSGSNTANVKSAATGSGVPERTTVSLTPEQRKWICQQWAGGKLAAYRGSSLRGKIRKQRRRPGQGGGVGLGHTVGESGGVIGAPGRLWGGEQRRRTAGHENTEGVLAGSKVGAGSVGEEWEEEGEAEEWCECDEGPGGRLGVRCAGPETQEALYRRHRGWLRRRGAWEAVLKNGHIPFVPILAECTLPPPLCSHPSPEDAESQRCAPHVSLLPSAHKAFLLPSAQKLSLLPSAQNVSLLPSAQKLSLLSTPRE